jgi:elongation factor P
MAKITTAEFRKGMFIVFKGEPHQIVEFQHVNPGKGGAFVRSRLKSLKSGKVQDFTFKAGEGVTEVPVETREMQYLYKDGENYAFMDNFSYDQVTVPAAVLSDYAGFLKENDTYQILMNDELPVGVRFPKKVRLKVIEAAEGARGNTVSGATKTVIVETGVAVTVPLFIREGDTIAIDPETGSYLERS